MMATTTPYRSDLAVGRDGFPALLRAEWTKFRTVRGWVAGLVAAALLTVLVGLVAAAGSHIDCGGGPAGPGGSSCHDGPPAGPDGEAVTDRLTFVHRPLSGSGAITVRVTALTGLILSAPTGHDRPADPHPGLEPWAKAGLIVRAGTAPGSAYAAIMVTGGHGVRMQYDYTHDTPGRPGAVAPAQPRWLRLTRSGDTVTGYESVDGTHWAQVGRARLAGLPSTVPAGLFVASPNHQVTSQSFGQLTSTGSPAQATAAFDHTGLVGRWAAGGWSGDAVARSTGGLPTPGDGFQESGGRFTVSGSGDLAPAVAGPDPDTVEQSLVGVFAGLIAVIVVAAMFVTAEYRRGLIRTTFAASPRRGRVLAAKAVVLGGVAFVTGLAAAAVADRLVGRVRRGNGATVLPVPSLTELRVVAGTAALLAVAAVLALAVGAVLRRGAGAVAAVVALLVVPYILAISSVLPTVPAQWLLRVTPAAAFAIQQSIPRYSQVSGTYTPATGYFPLGPWTGFGVLCAWTALALALAVARTRWRDA